MGNGENCLKQNSKLMTFQFILLKVLIHTIRKINE